MNLNPYRQQFPNRAIFPVIHVRDYEQAHANLTVAQTANVDGVFLIQHGASHADTLETIIERLRQDGRCEELWLAANFLTSLNHRAFALSHQLGLDGIWTDNAYALTFQARHDDEMRKIHNDAKTDRGEKPILYFGGAAFKYQPQAEDWVKEAEAAIPFTDVVTTSGPETGRAASIEKLRAIRNAIGNHPLAVASGVTAKNVTEQLRYADAVLVATSISDDFDTLSLAKLNELVEIVHAYQPPN